MHPNITPLSRPSRFGRGPVPLALLLAIATTAAGQGTGKPAKPVVLVPPFENQTKIHESISYEVATGTNPNSPKKRYAVDRFTEAPRSLFEDLLTRIEGVTVVERQRVDAMLVESEFGAMSGMVDSEKAVRMGKLLGAQFIIMGSLMDLRAEKRDFAGYGIRTRNIEVLCSLRVRLLDIASGTVKFSKVVQGKKTYSQSNYGGETSTGPYFAAVEAAIQQLEEDAQFKSALLGPSAGAGTTVAPGELVEIEFAPKP